MHIFKYISLLTKTTEDIYLLFRVFYKYKLTSISYSMYIYICSIDTSTCFNSMSSIMLDRYNGVLLCHINRLNTKKGFQFYCFSFPQKIFTSAAEYINFYFTIVKVSQALGRLKIN